MLLTAASAGCAHSAPTAKMLAAAASLDFEKAAKFRDELLALKGEKPMATEEKSRQGRRKSTARHRK